MASDTPAVHLEDIASVRSRISWGAIFGGAITALACSLVLTFFFAAIGVSLTGADVRNDTIGTGAIIAAIVTMLISLFVGGWVATQLTAGETGREAIIYGILTWALVTGASMLLVAGGIRAGYFAAVGGTTVTQNAAVDVTPSWEQNMRNRGVSQATIDKVRAEVNPDRLPPTANDPANQRLAERAAVTASWTVFVATILSIAAAIYGAIVGAGPYFRLFPMRAVRQQEIIVAR